MGRNGNHSTTVNQVRGVFIREDALRYLDNTPKELIEAFSQAEYLMDRKRE